VIPHCENPKFPIALSLIDEIKALPVTERAAAKDVIMQGLRGSNLTYSNNVFSITGFSIFSGGRMQVNAISRVTPGAEHRTSYGLPQKP
jgi:hypothetical protein